MAFAELTGYVIEGVIGQPKETVVPLVPTVRVPVLPLPFNSPVSELIFTDPSIVNIEPVERTLLVRIPTKVCNADHVELNVLKRVLIQPVVATCVELSFTEGVGTDTVFGKVTNAFCTTGNVR